MAVDVKVLREKVIETLAKFCGKTATDIKPTCNIVDDIGADQLDITEIIMELEDLYDIEIADEEAEKLATVDDLVAYVFSKVEKKEVPEDKKPPVKTEEELKAEADAKAKADEEAKVKAEEDAKIKAEKEAAEKNKE